MTIQTTYDIIITQGNTNTKGSVDIMKKRSKMLLSLFLSAMMVFSVVPSTVLAETAPEETPISKSHKLVREMMSKKTAIKI